MSMPSKGTSVPSSASSPEFREVIVKRDGNRPISFSGQTLAKVSMDASLAGSKLSAALYKTRGGKFVAALSRTNNLLAAMERLRDAEESRSSEINKAQVFDSFDDAVAWFRPGRLTDALRKQLGLDEPERIE